MSTLIKLVILLCASWAVLADVQVANPEVTRLHDIFDRHWNRDMRENPVWASMLGDRRYNREWTDLSLEAFEARHEADIDALEELQAVDRELLPANERVNYDLFERRVEMAVEGYGFRAWLMPISQRGGIQTLDETGNRLRMQTVQDYEDWLARLSKLDTYMDQTIALMREGMRAGIMPPKVTMQRVPAQIEKQLVENPEESLFFEPFHRMPDNFAEPDARQLRRAAREVIATTVLPAYRRLYDFFMNTYLPACRDSVGLSALPNGKAFYEHRVRRFTTTEMTPDEVHALGLREVSRDREAMLEVMAEVGFEGSLQEFFEYLRKDPRFYYETPEALFEGYLATSKRIDPKLIQLFGKLPRMPYGVKKIPDAIAPDTTTAYYTRPAADGSRPGYFWVNLYKPETRPKWEMPVLAVHEAVPGHHLQIAIQQELEDLPDFRRYTGFTVFTEGWGLYSERLGYEIGMYDDPYDRFGQLTYDMWRAVRLVVDTGMHYKGWSRDEAIEYFMDNAPKTRLDIVNEIDRYIADPGQALAYKLGQLKLIEMRERAEQELGDAFDVRAFHDQVLSQGAVPLTVLEDLVDDWLAEQS